jgi:hypothetical protein
MSDRHAELLLATLARAGRPLSTGDLMDEATGLALHELWTSGDVKLNRKRVAGIMQSLKDKGLVKESAMTVDEEHRRPAPTYELVDRERNYPVPPPPTAKVSTMPVRAAPPPESAYGDLSRTEMLVLLDAQDELLGVFARNMAAMASFAHELAAARERCRARLVAAGLMQVG